MTGFEHLFLPSHGLGVSFPQHHRLSVVRPPLLIFFVSIGLSILHSFIKIVSSAYYVASTVE